MKKNLLIGLLAMLGMSAAFTSCQKNPEPTPDDDPEEVTFSVSPRTMTFAAANAEAQVLTVTSANYIKAESAADWCVVEGISGSNNTYTYNVSCSQNYDAAERTTVVRILRISTQLDSVVITQQAADTTGMVKAHLLGLGWNLGNQFDAHNNGVASETAWGNPACTQATFDGVKAAGFDWVRIPITWMGHIGAAPEYKIEDAYLDRIATAVGYAETAGLKAVINIHHDGADSKYWLNIKQAASSDAENQAITEELTALWTQIANRFKDKGDFLMFETMNEIHDGGWGYGTNLTDGGKQYGILNAWNQACVDAIRATGSQNATRWIGCPAYSTNIDLAISSWQMPTDPAGHVALAVHCYDPYNFTLGATVNTWGTAVEKATLDATLKKVKNNFLDQGIQAYIGEMGCVQRASDADEHYRCEYLAYYAQTAYKYGLSIGLWDNAAGVSTGGEEANCFINHGTGAYVSDKGQAAVDALVNGYK